MSQVISNYLSYNILNNENAFTWLFFIMLIITIVGFILFIFLP